MVAGAQRDLSAWEVEQSASSSDSARASRQKCEMYRRLTAARGGTSPPPMTRRLSVTLLAALCGIVCVGMMPDGVHANDQTILGKELQVSDPAPGVDATKRKIVGKGLKKGSTKTIQGDPTVSGATLTISTEGTTASAETFNLPMGTDPKGKPF